MRIRFISIFSLPCPPPTDDKVATTFTLRLLRQLPSFREWGKFKKLKIPREFLSAILDFNHFIRFLA